MLSYPWRGFLQYRGNESHIIFSGIRILAESSSDDESFSLEELRSRIVPDIETQYFQTSFEMRRFEIIFRNRDIFRVPSGRS